MIITALLFQSTHPVWGATIISVLLGLVLAISIHAPRVGCDKILSNVMIGDTEFQSTHPVWGATLHAYIVKIINEQFQSTHPVWGATLIPSFFSSSFLEFQSTHPVWGATLIWWFKSASNTISIHAPRVGCDVVLWPLD